MLSIVIVFVGCNGSTISIAVIIKSSKGNTYQKLIQYCGIANEKYIYNWKYQKNSAPPIERIPETALLKGVIISILTHEM